MKIRITKRNVMTHLGVFDTGNKLSTPKYSEAFLIHLVDQCGAAEYIETKVIDPVEENKSIPKKKISKKKSRKKRKKPS